MQMHANRPKMAGTAAYSFEKKVQCFERPLSSTNVASGLKR